MKGLNRESLYPFVPPLQTIRPENDWWDMKVRKMTAMGSFVGEDKDLQFEMEKK